MARHKNKKSSNVSNSNKKYTLNLKKKKKVAKTICLSIFFIFAAIFVTATLILLFYDFEANENILSHFASKSGIIYDEFNKFGINTVFRSFGFFASIAAWNAIGFIAAKKEYIFSGDGIVSVIIDVLLYIIYLAGLCGLLAVTFISQNITLSMDVQNPTVYGDSFIPGLLWLAMILFSFVSFGCFLVLRLTGTNIWLSTIVFILIPVLFLPLFVILCWLVVGIIADKIPVNFSSSYSDSSGDDRKTYTYTNDMGCETTVVSDNGTDFYDSSSGEYMGSSTDGGETIIPK